MADYYKMKDGRLEKVVGLVSTEVGMKNAKFLTKAEAASIGAFPKAENRAETRPGFIPRASGFELEDGEWRTLFSYVEIRRTIGDFNAALENHLRMERIKRGYDTREPSQYVNSTVERWRQDAEDWIAHVDEVMLYGLQAINAYKKSGEAPDLGEFRKNLPKIEWTFAEEQDL